MDSGPVGRNAEIAEIRAYLCAAPWAAIDQAVDAGLIERDDGVLRFTHPQLRSVLASGSRR